MSYAYTATLREAGIDVFAEERLNGGALGDVYRLETSAGDVVAKTNKNGWDHGLRLSKQSELMKWLSARGICVPEVIGTYRCDAGDLLLYRFVAGRTLNDASGEDAGALGAYLHSLHSLAATNDLKDIVGGMRRDIKGLWYAKATAEKFSDDELLGMRNQTSAFKAPETDLSLLHGDAISRNFLMTRTGSIVGIDWEMAGLGFVEYEYAWSIMRTEWHYALHGAASIQRAGHFSAEANKHLLNYGICAACCVLWSNMLWAANAPPRFLEADRILLMQTRQIAVLDHLRGAFARAAPHL